MRILPQPSGERPTKLAPMTRPVRQRPNSSRIWEAKIEIRVDVAQCLFAAVVLLIALFGR